MIGVLQLIQLIGFKGVLELIELKKGLIGLLGVKRVISSESHEAYMINTRVMVSKVIRVLVRLDLLDY